MQRTAQGLTMRLLTTPELARKSKPQDPQERWWTVEHDLSYRAVQFQFLQTVQMGDHTGFMELIRERPWHIDTLLQLSEVARHQDDNNQASDLVERALFAYERAFVTGFHLTAGMSRLEFDRIENRPFFLALHRNIMCVLTPLTL